MLSTQEIRRRFLAYFIANGHLPYPSASLVPPAPSPVLFSVAGMQQMIPYFLGHDKPPSLRLTTAQKCFRTVDIDDVGNTRTLTFFEMLGNFSIGDYFKEGAIPFAYELLRDGFGLDPQELWYSVHPSDDAAVKEWMKIGIRRDRIVALEDNWWPDLESQGPCGPDSEIFVDRGTQWGCGKPTCGPGCDCPRFLEIWNLVFMQYNRDPAGVLHDLPKPNIDTGMGLERMAQALQGVGSVYETDAFQTVLLAIGEATEQNYGGADRVDRAMRVVADHARSSSFLIADGVIPSNTGRGYVLRRIIRRAVRNAQLLGAEHAILGSIAQVIIDQLGSVYPELTQRHGRIMAILGEEEARFSVTLASGLHELERLVIDMKARGDTVLIGSDIFRLYDSHGLPLEVAEEVARDEGLSIDRAKYEELLDEQRRRGQEIARADKGTIAGDKTATAFEGVESSVFLGYESTSARGVVLRIVADQQVRDQARQGEHVWIALDQTPFYGLGGGQVADTGMLEGPSGDVAVTDVQRTGAGVLIHVGMVSRGAVSVGDEMRAEVDAVRRADTARNHTATHLLHRALRGVLGDQVTQAGSVVAPDRLRFDFTFGTTPTPDQLQSIEREINDRIQADIPVATSYSPLAEARAEGAMALFGEKYGEIVRTVAIDAYSKELCGGTHVPRTGVIGSFMLTSESGIGAGHRRVEALTGPAAVEAARRQRQTLDQVTHVLQATPETLVARVQALIDDQQLLRRRLEQTERDVARAFVDRLAAQAVRIGSLSFVAAQAPTSSVDVLREMSDWLRDRLGSAVIVLGAVTGERATIVVGVTPDLVQAGWDAGALAKEIGIAGGGSGGGRPHLGQAGIRDVDRLADGIERANQLIATGRPPSPAGQRR